MYTDKIEGCPCDKAKWCFMYYFAFVHIQYLIKKNICVDWGVSSAHSSDYLKSKIKNNIFLRVQIERIKLVCKF